MQYSGTDHSSQDVRENPGGISEGMSDITEYDLIHPIIGTDIKHIDFPEWVKQVVTSCCDQAAEQVKTHAAQISTERKIRCVRLI